MGSSAQRLVGLKCVSQNDITFSNFISDGLFDVNVVLYRLYSCTKYAVLVHHNDVIIKRNSRKFGPARSRKVTYKSKCFDLSRHVILIEFEF